MSPTNPPTYPKGYPGVFNTMDKRLLGDYLLFTERIGCHKVVDTGKPVDVALINPLHRSNESGINSKTATEKHASGLDIVSGALGFGTATIDGDVPSHTNGLQHWYGLRINDGGERKAAGENFGAAKVNGQVYSLFDDWRSYNAMKAFVGVGDGVNPFVVCEGVGGIGNPGGRLSPFGFWESIEESGAEGVQVVKPFYMWDEVGGVEWIEAPGAQSSTSHEKIFKGIDWEILSYMSDMAFKQWASYLEELQALAMNQKSHGLIVAPEVFDKIRASATAMPYTGHQGYPPKSSSYFQDILETFQGVGKVVEMCTSQFGVQYFQASIELEGLDKKPFGISIGDIADTVTGSQFLGHLKSGFLHHANKILGTYVGIH